MSASERRADTDRFYRLLHELARRVGGPRKLEACTASTGWPRSGVYFFFEATERRDDGSLRVVRVGTHGLRSGSRQTLWARLAQHKGTRSGGGNHEVSIFRKHVGSALIRSGADGAEGEELCALWLGRSRPLGEGAKRRLAEIERRVSQHIGAMPLLWLGMDGADERGWLERNAIALLSARRGGVDRPSPKWLGRHAANERVRTSGLWNDQLAWEKSGAGLVHELLADTDWHQRIVLVSWLWFHGRRWDVEGYPDLLRELMHWMPPIGDWGQLDPAGRLWTPSRSGVPLLPPFWEHLTKIWVSSDDRPPFADAVETIVRITRILTRASHLGRTAQGHVQLSNEDSESLRDPAIRPSLSGMAASTKGGVPSQAIGRASPEPAVKVADWMARIWESSQPSA